MKKAKQESTAKLRMEDIPEYCKEKLRMEKIEAEYQKIEHELNELVFKRNNPEHMKEQIMDQLLELDPEELTSKDNVSLTGMEALNEQLSNLNRKMTVLKKMVDAQKLKLSVAKGAAIRKILPGYLEDYRSIVKRMAEGIIAVGDIIQEEESFRREAEMVHRGLASYLVPTPAAKIGKATDGRSYAHLFLMRASNAGHIPASMVPEAR